VAGPGYTVLSAMVNELIARGFEHVVFSGGCCLLVPLIPLGSRIDIR
jgi:hypothetical protein